LYTSLHVVAFVLLHQGVVVVVVVVVMMMVVGTRPAGLSLITKSGRLATFVNRWGGWRSVCLD
jgi:hypothetical protein